jgi:hypothetical protein
MSYIQLAYCMITFEGLSFKALKTDLQISFYESLIQYLIKNARIFI